MRWCTVILWAAHRTEMFWIVSYQVKQGTAVQLLKLICCCFYEVKKNLTWGWVWEMRFCCSFNASYHKFAFLKTEFWEVAKGFCYSFYPVCIHRSKSFQCCCFLLGVMETALFCNGKHDCPDSVNYCVEQLLNYTYTNNCINKRISSDSFWVLDTCPFLSFHSVYGLEQQLQQRKVRRGAFNIKNVNCTRLSSVSTSGCSSPQSPV